MERIVPYLVRRLPHGVQTVPHLHACVVDVAFVLYYTQSAPDLLLKRLLEILRKLIVMVLVVG